MKTSITLFAIALSVFGVQSGAEAAQAKATVKGMVCSFCAQGIKDKFKAEDAVEKVDVNLDKHAVTLTFKEGKSLDEARIAELLSDSGYTVDGKIEK